jgi:MYXO-CTERM domain-containing protein
MMANAARDPVFWAGIAVAAQDVPGGTELCVRCHAPKAFLDGVGAAESIEELAMNQRFGTECEFCHRMVDDGVTPPGNAQYTIDDVMVGSEVPRRGPWDFTDGNPEPPHSWIYDPYIGTSRFCGTCHDVTTPVERVDDQGVGMGTNFNEQRTYSEWLNSAYADGGTDPKSCQDCHMPALDDTAGCTEHQNTYSHETGFRRHDLVGANRFMVELLKQEYGSLGSNEVADVYFNTTLDYMDDFLQTAASLDVSAPSDVDLAEGLSGLDVTVTNNTGHKLPSGYSEGRIMWIEVVARYGEEVVYSSGLWDQDAGLDHDDQLRSYEAIGQEFATGTTLHLLLNNYWAVDNRIPPKGLTPDIETDPVGDRYTLQMDGTWPHFDSTSYTFGPASELYDATPRDQGDDTLDLTVRVLYLINTPEYIDFLGDNGGEAGVEVAALFETAGGAYPVTLAEQSLSIPITGFGTEPPGNEETGTESETTTESTSETGSESTGSTGPSESTETDTTATDPSESEEVGTTAPAEEDGGGGCDCRSGGDSGGGWALFLPGLLYWRRRRQL